MENMYPSNKKFSTKVIFTTETGWVVQIVRRKKRKDPAIVMEIKHLPSEDAALRIATVELEKFIKKRTEDKIKATERRNENRSRRQEREKFIDSLSFQELERRGANEPDCRELFKYKANLLWQEVAYRVIRCGYSESDAMAQADALVGKHASKWKEKARTGELDIVDRNANGAAVAAAQDILSRGLEMSGRNVCVDPGKIQ